MANLKLKFACWDYDRSRPLMDERVKPDGIDLDIHVMRPQQTFSRMLDNQEFDASELSLASYASLKARGACPFVAIPVALSKIFRHSCIYVRTGSGIETPQGLQGKRVGTMQYGATAVVFMKGMIQHEYGVAAHDMHWFVGGLDRPTERPLIPLDLPKNIKLEFIREGATLESLLDADELDAIFSIYVPPMFLKGSRRISRLFPNFKQVEQEYYLRTRIFPIMHIVVIREDVHRQHPWVARSLYKAFCEARDIAVGGLYDTDALRVSLPWLLDHVEETWRVFGKDFWAYGLEPNRPTFEALGRYVHEQGLAPRVVKPEELFAPDLE